MSNNQILEVPAAMVETPLDEVIVLLSQVRHDLAARGYGAADIAGAFLSVGVAASSDLHGNRETSRELYMFAVSLRELADASDAQPKH